MFFLIRKIIFCVTFIIVTVFFCLFVVFISYFPFVGCYYICCFFFSISVKYCFALRLILKLECQKFEGLKHLSRGRGGVSFDDLGSCVVVSFAIVLA